MTRKYFLAPKAKADLSRVSDHIALDNPVAALRLIDTLEAKFEFLAEQPFAGSSCDHLLPGLRYFAVGNYVIYHRVSKNATQIVRVLHGAQNAEAIFRQSEYVNSPWPRAGGGR